MNLYTVKKELEEERQTVKNHFIGKEQILLRISNRNNQLFQQKKDILEIMEIMKKAIITSCGHSDIDIYIKNLQDRNKKMQKLSYEINKYTAILDWELYDK